MSRLTPLAISIALVACDPPPRLVIDGAVPFRSPDCVADLDAPRLSRTRVDVTQAEYGATAVLAVDAEPPESLAVLNTALVWFLGAPSSLPSSRASARIDGLQTTLFDHQQPADGVDELAVVELLTGDEVALLVDAPDGVLDANISVEGLRADDRNQTFESEPLTIAIDVCHGCLVVACVDQRPCVVGQDDPVGPPCPAP